LSLNHSRYKICRKGTTPLRQNAKRRRSVKFALALLLSGPFLLRRGNFLCRYEETVHPSGFIAS
jgi:hypothetical protein